MSDNLFEYLALADLYYMLSQSGEAMNSPYAVKLTNSALADYAMDGYTGHERSSFDPEIMEGIQNLFEPHDIPDVILLKKVRRILDEDNNLHSVGLSLPSLQIEHMILLWGEVSSGTNRVAERIHLSKPNSLQGTSRSVFLHRTDYPVMVNITDLRMWHSHGELNRMIHPQITCKAMEVFWTAQQKLLRDKGGPHRIQLGDIEIDMRGKDTILNDESIRVNEVTSTWNTILGKNISDVRAGRVLANCDAKFNQYAKNKFFDSNVDYMIFVQAMQDDINAR